MSEQNDYRSKDVRLKRTTRHNECILCGKILTTIAHMVHVIDGGRRILHPADEEKYQSDNADLYWLPIGSECAKRLGREWSIVLEKATEQGQGGQP